MKKEPNAVYIGDHKIGYRMVQNGVIGLAYVKGEKCDFVSLDELIRMIKNDKAS